MFFQNPHEEEIREIYDRYRQSADRMTGSGANAPDEGKMNELNLLLERISLTMLLSDRLIYFLTEPGRLADLWEAVSEQETKWFGSLDPEHKDILAKTITAVKELNKGQKVTGNPFHEGYDYTDCVRVYHDAADVLYFGLMRYVTVKTQYWRTCKELGMK